MTIGALYDCLCCLNQSALELRLDVKGRPYFVCNVCGCRLFMRGKLSMKGPERLWGPLTLALRKGDAAAANVLVGDAVKSETEAQNANG